jgi:type VI secretion system ImpC/EvpB family protein
MSAGGAEEDGDATILLSPARQAPAPPRRPAIAALRDDVLAGAYVGDAHRDAAARLASLLAPRKIDAPRFLETWFGTAAAQRLACDKDALRAAVDRDIVAIDARIGAMLDAILHHARFRKLEGSWRALYWLAGQLGVSGRIKLRMLNLSWAELVRDLERVAEFDQSQTFRRIYEDEFGMPGGEPYGFMVLDYEVRHRPGPGAITDDVTALLNLSAVAAAAFAPMVVGATPALFGVDEFAELSGVAEPARGFVAAEYARWRSIGVREDVRFMSVVLPRVLARRLWSEAPEDHRGFWYRETVGETAERVWANAGYVVASCVMRAFDAFNWPADMRGYDIDREGGGVVTDLPDDRMSTDPRDGFSRSAVEIVLTDRQERSLIEAGLMPVGALPWGGEALVSTARSLQTPLSRHGGANADAASANTKLSAQFNTMICVSRFAHYVKVMGRDMLGAFLTPDVVERRLRDWLLNYTNTNTAAGPETMAKYPLRSSQVAVSEIPGKPGVYRCEIHLQPHFQLDDIAASFRLLTDLAAPGAR